MDVYLERREQCPACGVWEGEWHEPGCDLEQCPRCGGQYISCRCGLVHLDDRIQWSGWLPGEAEAVEWGWWHCRLREGWVPCQPRRKGARPDCGRVYENSRWSPLNKRFIPAEYDPDQLYGDA